MMAIGKSEISHRAIKVIRDNFLSAFEPCHWLQKGSAAEGRRFPDAILAHLQEPDFDVKNIVSTDVVLHVVVVCDSVESLCAWGEDGKPRFPLLDVLAEIAGNYRWLVLSEDLGLDGALAKGLGGKCRQQEIGLIFCADEEENDEIHYFPEQMEGDFLSAYDIGEEVIGELSSRMRQLLEEDDRYRREGDVDRFIEPGDERHCDEG